MTARRSKPSFASLLRSVSRRDDEPAPATPDPIGTFRVDPTRVRLWSGLVGPSAEECRDRIAAIVRDGQTEPVTVRPVFDDALVEYEVIAGARDWVAVRHLRDTAISSLDLLVRVELVDDDGAARLVPDDPLPQHATLPAAITTALGGHALPAHVAADLAERLDGPMGPAIIATAVQIARAQAARSSDGLPPYPAGEVMRLIDAVGVDDAPPLLEKMSLSIVAASASGVTLQVEAGGKLPPEVLARVVKAMIDGAAADGVAVSWGGVPTAATSP